MTPTKIAVTALTLLALLGGCGRVQRSVASVTGAAYKQCVDGVTYLQFTSGATVQVDRSGKPIPCGAQ